MLSLQLSVEGLARKFIVKTLLKTDLQNKNLVEILKKSEKF
jgi:hypothetical protein